MYTETVNAYYFIYKKFSKNILAKKRNVNSAQRHLKLFFKLIFTQVNDTLQLLEQFSRQHHAGNEEKIFNNVLCLH